MLKLYARYLSAREALKKMLSGEEEGQTIVEYILIILVISLIILASSPGLVNAISNVIDRVTTSLNSASPAGASS